ncbi:MAG: hypothetical protein FD165_1819 [Gammaproteobacteria bacterium]|nr:MAG: hypothetical protein FD165_1819 [Gammaproteobacteria bacterium]TND04393.1 MAG: hypothetical protein FD120_1507 [Gammaproteobacteria bacterium]
MNGPQEVTANHSAHAAPITRVLEQFVSNPNGLADAEARQRLERFGPNRLSERRGRGPLLRFALQFHNLLIYVMLTAALVTAALGQWVDTGVIVGVVVINALVGFLQEGKAEQALAAIRRMLSLKATVLRDGRPRVLPAEELVPGDVVLVQSGDRIPADLRLIQVKNFRVEEAALTGESVPVDKHTEPVAGDAVLGDRRNMAYSGTLVSYGQARGVVVATGDATELGRISQMLSAVEHIETPLLRKIAAFSQWLTLAIATVAAATFALGVGVHDQPAADMFMAAVGLAVAAIPEGLPAIITITLAIGVQRMARRNAIIRVLPAVEALGSVTVICSDKTGTLTRNEMTVQSVATAEHRYGVSGVGYAPDGAFVLNEQPVDVDAHPDLAELLRAGLLCNDAQLRKERDQWTIDGDPTEGALVVAALKGGFDARLEAERLPRIDVIPFESEHRFMATLHHDHAGHGFVYLKGAPERVLDMCALERFTGTDRPLRRDHWHARIQHIAAQGQRVLALAFRAAAGQRELSFGDVEDGLTLLGVVGMIDPPREEAIRAIAACHAAGIAVKMITGDHAATATAIAVQLGIGDGSTAITGQALAEMDAEGWRDIASKASVYARVSPEHKLKLVEALQAQGAVVAMTGDGVNDAPALKRADVGVAMGITGTEVAKEAAEIVLADDNFATIINAVEEGRTVYDNLRKTILFIMPTNGAEAGTLVTAIALGMVLPILPVQILWVNMVTAVTLSLALVFEPTEADTMRRPPRAPDAALFSGYFVWRTLLVTLLAAAGVLGMFLWEQAQGASVAAARTAAVNTLVVIEVFYLLNTRYLLAPAWPQRALTGNRYVPLSIAAALTVQLLFTYAPFMQTLFHTAALGAEVWGRIVLIGGVVYAVVELEKWLVRALGFKVV